MYTFKNKVKNRKYENCPCRLYKIYIDKGKKIGKEKKNLGYPSSIFAIIAVSYQYRFATNKFKILLFTFLTVYFEPIDESSGFQAFCIYVETNQLIY